LAIILEYSSSILLLSQIRRDWCSVYGLSEEQLGTLEKSSSQSILKTSSVSLELVLGELELALGEGACGD